MINYKNKSVCLNVNKYTHLYIQGDHKIHPPKKFKILKRYKNTVQINKSTQLND